MILSVNTNPSFKHQIAHTIINGIDFASVVRKCLRICAQSKNTVYDEIVLEIDNSSHELNKRLRIVGYKYIKTEHFKKLVKTFHINDKGSNRNVYNRFVELYFEYLKKRNNNKLPPMEEAALILSFHNQKMPILSTPCDYMAFIKNLEYDENIQLNRSELYRISKIFADDLIRQHGHNKNHDLYGALYEITKTAYRNASSANDYDALRIHSDALTNFSPSPLLVGDNKLHKLRRNALAQGFKTDVMASPKYWGSKDVITELEIIQQLHSEEDSNPSFYSHFIREPKVYKTTTMYLLSGARFQIDKDFRVFTNSIQKTQSMDYDFMEHLIWFLMDKEMEIEGSIQVGEIDHAKKCISEHMHLNASSGSYSKSRHKKLEDLIVKLPHL